MGPKLFLFVFFLTLVFQTTCRLRDVSCTNLTIVFELFNIFRRPNYSLLWCKKICLLPVQVKKKVMRRQRMLELLTTCSLGTE